jgi:hypothetical protein
MIRSFQHLIGWRHNLSHDIPIEVLVLERVCFRWPTKHFWAKKPCKKSAKLHRRQGILLQTNILTGLNKTSLYNTKRVGDQLKKLPLFQHASSSMYILRFLWICIPKDIWSFQHLLEWCHEAIAWRHTSCHQLMARHQIRFLQNRVMCSEECFKQGDHIVTYCVGVYFGQLFENQRSSLNSLNFYATIFHG